MLAFSLVNYFYFQKQMLQTLNTLHALYVSIKKDKKIHAILLLKSIQVIQFSGLYIVSACNFNCLKAY